MKWKHVECALLGVEACQMRTAYALSKAHMHEFGMKFAVQVWKRAGLSRKLLAAKIVYL